LLIKVLEVFEAFQQTAWDIFMRQPVKQIAYKYCVNLRKLNFRSKYSASADTIVAL